MARVVDFCPSSDDELPDLSTLLKKPTQKLQKPSLTLKESPKKDLVPKSPAKSVARKVRRLESNSQLKGNLLFQRCDPGEDKDAGSSFLGGSPRKSPTKRRGREAASQSNIFASDSIFAHDDSPPRKSPTKRRGREAASQSNIFANDSIFSRGDSPPRTARANRKARSRIIPILEDDDDSYSESAPSVRVDQLLQTQTPALRRLKLGPPVQPKKQATVTPATETAKEEEEDTARAISEQLSATMEEMQLEEDHDDGPANESSMHRTADDEESSGYNDTSGSEFVSDVSSQSTDSDTNVLKPRDLNSLCNTTFSQLPEQTTGSAIPPPVNTSVDMADKVHDEPAGANTTLDLASQLSKLYLESGDQENEPPTSVSQTPPQTPSKSKDSTGLPSRTKKTLIPKTPHRPSTDAFWNQEFVDDWNEQHSPRKLLLPSQPKSPSKMSPTKEAKRIFDSKKHGIAESFLKELDTEITQGRIGELAESTGGVKIAWSKTLNTTAGRAHWRHETIRVKGADGNVVDVRRKHHAHIELAEKVIDEEHKLLDTLAHEFCHLANYMISDIRNNPHGKEFKAWGAKCNRAFADRGVKVTTKHSYEIAFKYVWECLECGKEYKRHSRSIDPKRARCGKCKGSLKQTKPAPRGGGKPSEYQTFVREQMKVVKAENPGVPQKDVMKLIAAKWSAAQASASGEAPAAEAEVEEELVTEVIDLTL